MRAKFSEMTYEGGPAKCCHAGKGGHGESVWMTAEQIPVKGSYTEKGPRRARTPQLCGRHRPVPARPVQHDVRDASVDHPSVRRLLDRRREQRLLPPQPRIGAEGSFGGVRPRHPPRLRRRPSARGGRRGQGGRFDMLRGGHESALRRHSARPDVRIDDDERRRAPGTGLLHRLWARTGRPSRPDGRHDTERHPQRSSWCATPTSTRPNSPCGLSPTSSNTRPRTCPSSTPSPFPATTCRRRGRRPTSSWPIRWPTVWSTSAPVSMRA